MLLREKIKRYYIDLVKGEKRGVLAKLVSFFLLLLSFVYGFFIRLILFCYQKGLFNSFRPKCRVISIGNISWGGTAKTPLVEKIAGYLQQQGRHPAVLSRGYGEDELEMLRQKLKEIPVLGARDRIKSAKEALRRHRADTIILDDGFQHWRLMRDIDIVLIDAAFPFGNRRLLPRGILREPLSSLQRADIFILTKADEAKNNAGIIRRQLKKYNSQAPVYEAEYQPDSLYDLNSGAKIAFSEIKNQKIGLLSAIACPQSFEKTALSLGAKVGLRFDFCDHYQYTREDLETIEKQCLGRKISTILTTEKDAPKLIALWKSFRTSVELLVLSVRLKIVRDEEAFLGSLQGNKISSRAHSMLILSDGKAGHLNQAKAVAEMVEGKKAETGGRTIEVKFKNRFCRSLLNLCSIFSGHHCSGCLRCVRFCLEEDSFRALIESPADIIITAGSSLASVALFFSYRNRARNVLVMKPSFLNMDRFDLVIVPEHDRVKPADNVVSTKIAPNLVSRQYLKETTAALKKDLNLQLKGPIIGVLIGGDSAKYRLSPERMQKMILQLKQAAGSLNCQIMLTSSRRTPKPVEDLIKKEFSSYASCKLLVVANEKNIPQAVGGILGRSDIIVVSGESISMVSEAISAEKYVLVFIPEKKVLGRTKQERFLKKLEREGFLKIVEPERLFSAIKDYYQHRPAAKKINDKEKINQALNNLILNR